MAEAEAEAGAASGDEIWPAAIVHVNEDGWVLLNRGGRHGVVPGLRLLVVGDEARELRDVAVDDAPPTLVRIRRTYELLDVVYAEQQCAIAVAARVPRERWPQIYRAPEGELLVWVPLPQEYTWPPSPDEASDADDTSDDEPPGAQDADQDLDDGAADEGGASEEGEGEEAGDAESLAEQQEDDRWEQALPLNGLHVGDLVLPAIPVSQAGGGGTSAVAFDVADRDAASAAPLAPADQQETTYDAGREYGWLKPSP